MKTVISTRAASGVLVFLVACASASWHGPLAAAEEADDEPVEKAERSGKSAPEAGKVARQPAPWTRDPFRDPFDPAAKVELYVLDFEKAGPNGSAVRINIWNCPAARACRWPVLRAARW